MKKKLLLLGAPAAIAVLGLGLLLSGKLPVLGEANEARIILFTGENFTGRSLVVSGTLFDLPSEEDPDGSVFHWNDETRSLIVVSGTWRAFEHGRANTRLDDTKFEDFDIRTKLPDIGWSTLVSATSSGRLELPTLGHGGIGKGISSLELISELNLPDWALVFRKP
jgi:hypothetical protein